ncbi:MAG: RNA 2',3'-cyclic phosphodiesterase [Candidatus Pacearchaeota archaeon]
MRIFISMDIPEEIKNEIVKIQDSLPEFEGKITEKENLHLTLKFLGEVNKEKLELVKEYLMRFSIKVKNFEAIIDDIGIFSERSVRIVWLHVSNCDELQKSVDEALSNLFEKEKRFMAHLTIARVKKIKDKKLFIKQLKKIKIPKLKFSVNNFKLKESILEKNGPKYRDIMTYNLIGD